MKYLFRCIAILLVLTVIILIGASETVAETKVFEKEAEKIAGKNQSIEQARAARLRELEEIAKEQDRNFKELARKVQLSQANWIPIDETFSVEQAIEEAKNLKTEIADISNRLEFQYKSSKKNIKKAYTQEAVARKPILPPKPAPKDPFETTAEYNKRVEIYERKVKKAKEEADQKIKELKMEYELKKAQLKISVLEQRINVLKPFIQRLKVLQSKKFLLPEKKVNVRLGDPDADNSRFPVYIEHKRKKWTKYWYYNDRKKAKAFWKTRSHLIAQGIVQLESAGKGVTYRFTAVKISHLGTKEEQIFRLEKHNEFDEISSLSMNETEIANVKASMKGADGNK